MTKLEEVEKYTKEELGKGWGVKNREIEDIVFVSTDMSIETPDGFPCGLIPISLENSPLKGNFNYAVPTEKCGYLGHQVKDRQS